MATKDDLLEKATTTKRESKNIDFKEGIDVNSLGDWCEVIKDIVAMANSGGGIIIFGVKNDGKKSEIDTTPILNCDPADITNKIFKYTGAQFADFEIQEIERTNHTAVGLIINSGFPPMVFIKPGQYLAQDGKQQKTAFGQGTLYFRHGAKSEPANSRDVESIIEREIDVRKKNWLGNIRKVIKAPSDYEVQILPSKMIISDSPEATPMNITNDETGHKVNIDEDSLFKKIYNIDYYGVVKQAKLLFSDFKQNSSFNKAMKELKKDPSMHRVRYLDYNNTKSGYKDFYSKKIFTGLEKYYTPKK